MPRFRARAAVFLITSTLACTAVAAPALAAQVAVPTKGEAAAGWLARQMVNRSHFVTVFKKQTFPNQGATIDAILAFAATKSANDYGARAATWLKRPSILSGYIGDGTTSSFAGRPPNSPSPRKCGASTRPASAMSTWSSGWASCSPSPAGTPTTPSSATSATPSASPWRSSR